MVPQTQITELRPEAVYVLAHHCGHDYSGPSGGYTFVNGLVDGGETVPGYLVLANGLANITHYWEFKPGYSLVWSGDAFQYRKDTPAPVPVKPVTKSKPMVKAQAPKEPPKRRGRPPKKSRK